MKRIFQVYIMCAIGSLLSTRETSESTSSAEEAVAERYLLGELESAQSRMCGEIASALWNSSTEPSDPNAGVLEEAFVTEQPLRYSVTACRDCLSDNSGERLHYFKQWMRQTESFRGDFLELLKIIGMESQLNGFNNSADYVMFLSEWPTFREDTENVWNALLPFYRPMHELVRRRLTRMYGSKLVSPTGSLDVHLLGAQGYLTSDEVDLPATATWNETLHLSSKLSNLTAVRMLEVAESFYVSLGLPKLQPEFWERSLIEFSPSEAGFPCEASAWDFCNGRDYRIKMRSEATLSGLKTAYHELAHVYYFMQYKHLPHVFRTGANPGFHEAVADALSWLGIQSRTLQEHIGVGLMSTDAGMRNLLELAFDHVGQTFHAIATSKWLWKVLDEPQSDKRIDSLYWEMRLKYEGIRTSLGSGARRLRPSADYDFLAHESRIRSMFSFIAQMQIIRYLCAATNDTGRLHECDIHGSKEAGRRLMSILKLGSSEPLPEVMKTINGGRSKMLDTSAVLEYFSPVLEWLKNNEPEGNVGWSNFS